MIPGNDLRLLLFAHVVCRPEAEFDLGQAALVIAEPEYPDLDIAYYLGRLDELAARIGSQLSGSASPGDRAAQLMELLCDEGFTCARGDYDDPQASFLNYVLDEKHGLPILLAIVSIEVARRCGVPLWGVSFPGHFLLRGESDRGQQPLLFDPTTGEALEHTDLHALMQRATGKQRPIHQSDIEPVGKHTILARMLGNLRNIYLRHGDVDRLQLAAERLRLLDTQLPSGRPSTSHLH